MGQVIIRNLDDGVINRLKARAELHGRSLEQELREIVTHGAGLSPADRLTLADRVRAMTPGPLTSDSTDLVRADRDRR